MRSACGAPTTVTANRRLARALLDAHVREQLDLGRAGWETPDIVPLSQWCERLWWDRAARRGSDQTLLQAHQERAIWEAVISGVVPEGSVQLDATVTALARLAEDAWARMCAWEVGLDALETAPTPDVSAFRRWAHAFRERCRRGGFVDRASVMSWLARNLAAGDLPHRLQLRGLHPPTPQQQRLFTALEGAGVKLGLHPPARRATSVVRAAADTNEAELRLAARWVRAVLESDPQATLGVVVPRLEGLRDSVEASFREVLAPGALLPGAGRSPAPFNLSLGRPLGRVGVVRDALRVLELCFGRVSLADLGHCLRSPYLWSDSERFARARMDGRLRDVGEPGLDVGRLRSLCDRFGCHDLRHRLRRVQALIGAVPGRQSTSGWAQIFSSVLVAVDWPGSRVLGHDEYQAVSAFSELLRDFAGLAPLAPRQPASPALAKLDRMAAERIFQAKSPPARVQVLGVLESTGLEFSHLWVCGLDAVSWPPPARPHPLLPIALQRRLHMPHADMERELADCRIRIERWLTSAPTVVFSHARTDGEESRRPSRLILGYPPAAPQADVRSHATEIEAARPDQESLLDARGPPVSDSTSVRGGATVFRDQAACAFRAFARHRLGARGVAVADSELDLRARGILVHRVLELVWNEIAGRQRLAALGRSGRARVVADAVEAALDVTASRRARLVGELRELEAGRLRRLASDWLELELERADFVVQAPELTQSVEVGGLAVELRPDRVDRLADGTYLLIDYKTSRPALASWFGSRPEEPQLPLYTFAMEALGRGVHQVVGATTYGVLRRGDVAFLGLSDRDCIAPGVQVVERTAIGRAHGLDSFAAIKREWGVHLTALGEAFGAGRAEVDPKSRDKTCRVCDLHTLCRIHAADSDADGRAGAQE